jgi:hypothetical protein
VTYDNGDPTTYETVHVSTADLETVENHGSVMRVTGTTEDGRERITFAGDTRMMVGLFEAIVATDETQAAPVADYQILRAERIDPEMEGQ